MSIKLRLWDKIKEKAARKEKLSQEIEERSKNVESFVRGLLEELDDALATTVNTGLFEMFQFKEFYVKSVEQRIKLLDMGAKVEISWSARELDNIAASQHINGILIKWSQEYQNQHSCEPELFLDILTLLLG